MTVQGMPREPDVLQQMMASQDLLDFDQDMVLLLSRDLRFTHQGMKVLAVETRRGSWLVAPQSDFYFIQQLRQPILLSTFVKQNQWLPEEFIEYVIFYLYTKGILEVNGSAVWEPRPAGADRRAPARSVDLHLDRGGREDWGSLGKGLAALVTDRDERPLDLTLHGLTPAMAGPVEALLGRLGDLADQRRRPMRVTLARLPWDCPAPVLDLVRRFRPRLNLCAGDEGSLAEAIGQWRALGAPFQITLPWEAMARSEDLLWRALEAGAPGVGFGTFEGPPGPAAEARGRRLLDIVDRVLEKDIPPFMCQDVTPLLGRLTQFPWQVGVTECGGFSGGSVVADREGVCHPCKHFMDVPGTALGRLGKGPFDRYSSDSGRVADLHRPHAARPAWWFPFYHACPGVARRFHGGPGPDPRGRMFEVVLEGLMWRLGNQPERVAAQFGLLGAPETPDRGEGT